MKHNKNFRPWGWHKIIWQIQDKAWVKIVFVKQGERLSLQSHNNRSEIWLVIKGLVEARVGEKIHQLGIGRFVNISKKQKHRLTGIKDSYILEIALGCPKEEDIIRYEDDYGRANSQEQSQSQN